MKLYIELGFTTMLFTETVDYDLIMGERIIDKEEKWFNYITIYAR
jgi:hypothetical protein